MANTAQDTVRLFPSAREYSTCNSERYRTKQNRMIDDDNNNNTTHARARTREENAGYTASEDRARAARYIAKVKQEDWLNSCGDDLKEIYADVLGRDMPQVHQREIAGMLAEGIDRTLIGAVLAYTADAPRPSWAYARAVIYRNYAKGINSGLDFEDSIGRF